MWLLGDGLLSCFSIESGAVLEEQAISKGAVGVCALDEQVVQVIYPSQTVKAYAKE